MLFFVATNLAVWAEGALYPRTLDGLAACYFAAIPFFGWTLGGDLFYTALMFGLFAAGNARSISEVTVAPAGSVPKA